MKRTTTQFIKAALYSATLVAATVTFAETPRVEATSTTTTSAGTVSEFSPLAIVIKTEAGAQPVRYISNETTNYVDEKGNPVSLETVQSGLPVTVFYTKVGDTLVASKVMVRKDAAITTEASSAVVPDKVVIELVAPAQNIIAPSHEARLRSAGNITGDNKSGLAPEKPLDGFVMSNGRVFGVSGGRAMPLTQELSFRVTPSGFIGFDGQAQMLPEGAMFSSGGVVIAAPAGLRDANGNVFGMPSSNAGTSGVNSGDNLNNGSALFGFIPVNGTQEGQNGTQTQNGTQSRNGTPPETGTRPQTGTGTNGGAKGGGAK